MKRVKSVKFTQSDLKKIDNRAFDLKLFNEDWSYLKALSRAVLELKQEKTSRKQGKVLVRQIGLLEW